MKKTHKGLKIFGIVVLVIVLLIGIVLGCYAYNNLNFDKNQLKKVWKAGYIEKQTTLSDGTVLNYAEGPNNGPAVLLIHGQSVEWEDYSTVLPELSKNWHVFAVDCHGHGESSKNASDYTCTKMGNDFIEFIKMSSEKNVLSAVIHQVEFLQDT